MMGLWTEWWVWAAAAIAFAIGEVLLPAYVLLGFSGGAIVVAILLLIGGPFSIWLAASLPMTILIFAISSLVTWLLLRRILGVRRGQVKVFGHDINDD